VFLIISQKENGPLENQETDGRYWKWSEENRC
jgi:hypothetical protein